MPAYNAPGVYVVEKAPAPTITGVGTSTAAFVGAVKAAGGNNGEPKAETVLLTSWDQFKAKVGEIDKNNRDFAVGVSGFFLNGGSRCYVIKVQDSSATTGESVPKLRADNVKQAADVMEKIDEIAIVAAPGCTDIDVQKALYQHCETMKDRFAILDGQHVQEMDAGRIKGEVKDDAGTVTKDALADSEGGYAALYFPWIVVSNPLAGKKPPKDDSSTAPAEEPVAITVGPSGHVAGIYARVDAERGVHKAPANVVVRGALGVDYQVTQSEHDGLDKSAGINIIRNFSGDIRVWGARTLGGQEMGITFVNERRLLNYISESIEEGTRFAVFEPNNPDLWQRIKRTITGLLLNVWRDGALFGAIPEQAFYVRCDETNNPLESMGLGEVHVEVGLAVVKPAEFVIIQIAQIANSAT